MPALSLQPPLGDAARSEARAALALGRLDGALRHSAPAILRILAARVLRHTLVTALRQARYQFTDERFAAWFAGLVPLTEPGEQQPHGPRALVEAILTELAHNSWAALAQLAQQLRPAFLAPTDPDAEQEREEHHTILAEARQLASNLGHEEDALPFPALARLHVAIAASTRFAPAERTSVVLNLPGRQLAIERAPTPPPRWALELVMGEHWRRGGLLACALPCPGLIRLDALVERDGDPEEPRILRADALQEWATTMLGHIEASRCEADRIAAAPPGERRTSRAPALFELLRGFGPLRSAQIEAVLTISRLGAKGLLDAIMATGVAARTRIQGVWLYSARAHPSTSGAEDIPGHTFAFSTEALDEYDASIAVIGDLLARTGIDPQRDED